MPAGTCKAARACKRGQRHRGANAASRLGNGALGQPGKAAKERPHTDSGKSNLHSHPVPLKAHTVLGTKLWRNGTSCVLTPPISPPSNESIYPHLRLPYPGGDAMDGAGEEELRANNSNRNRVEPFQLFICQMDSFPALFFFFFLLQK